MRQSAYRIEVASSADALAVGEADLWDSGRVASDSCLSIRYGGAALASRQRCFWRVHIWDERGATCAPSAVAWWEMGLLDRSDWSVEWLGAEDQTMREDRATGLVWISRPAAASGESTQFRFDFSLPVAGKAMLFVAAFAKTDIWIDGNALAMRPATSLVMGPPEVVEFTVPLTAGRHVLVIFLSAADSPLEYLGLSDAEIAPFLRIRLEDGRVLRMNGTAGWQDAVPARAPRPQPWPKQPAILMRCDYSAMKPVHQARLYATALGAYELHLNGKRIGDGLLAPESTDFRKRALYQVYDVTSEITGGENVLGAVVGDGWYASYAGPVGRYAWGLAPRCLLACATRADLRRRFTRGHWIGAEMAPIPRTHRVL